MKNILVILMCMLSFTLMNAQKERDEFQIQVDGLGCPFCAYGLEKKFKEFKGIKDVEIEIETGDFKFTYPSEKKLTMNAIVDQVKKAGYTPKTAKIIRSNGEEEALTVPVSSSTASSELVDKTLTVKGNCQMCKARIEAAALTIKGVDRALWNIQTKELAVTFDANKTSAKAISKNIALAGHDTEVDKANEKVYDALPTCCSYNNPNLNSK